MSEDEEPEASRPQPPRATVGEAPAAFDDSYVEEEPQLVGASLRPKFGEMDEEPAYTPLPRDYASDLGNGVHPPDTIPQTVPATVPETIAETIPATIRDRRPQPSGALYASPAPDADRDLDVPAFMRRHQF